MPRLHAQGQFRRRPAPDGGLVPWTPKSRRGLKNPLIKAQFSAVKKTLLTAEHAEERPGVRREQRRSSVALNQGLPESALPESLVSDFLNSITRGESCQPRAGCRPAKEIRKNNLI